jgi:hypothetical protein
VADLPDELRCYLCKKSEADDSEVELRPYGPNGAIICFDCMIADPEREAEAKRQFASQCDAAGAVVVIGGSEGPRPMEKSRG